MATYEATVLADSPVLYYRLDMVGLATNGDSIPDLSGNAFHAELEYLQPGTTPAPYGYLSPIETDAASREFSGFNDGIHAATRVSRIGCFESDSIMEPAANFAVEGWVRMQGAAGGAAFGGTIMQAVTGRTGSTFIYIDHFNYLAGCTVDTAGTGWFTISPSAVSYGDSYHVVVERTGTTLALYVNGILVDTTSITSGLPNRMNPPGQFLNASSHLQDLPSFFIHPYQVSTAEFRLDEVAYYDHSLGAARVLAHYEAAKVSLFMTATLTTRVVVELDTDATLPVDFPFAHNFAEAIAGTERPLVEHLAFKTNINQSEPDYQQRINAQPYHLERTIETAVTPVNARGRAMMQAALWKPGNVYPLPVSNDWSELTSSSAAASSILNLDTRWRDYEVGSYVGVWSDVFNPATYQRFRITSVTDTQLGITPAVVTLLPAGSVAMPARLACLPEDTLALESHLIDTESAVLQFEVLATELSTRRVTAYTPAATYKSIEVFSLVRAKVEWADPVAAVSRQLRRRMSGTGNPTGNDYQRAVDTGSPQTIPLRVLCLTRQSISEFYGWMAARQGRQNPVWVVSQDNDLPVTATTATTATIAKIGYTAQYNAHSARRDVAFLKTDGSYVYKRITAAVDNGDGTETLTMAATVPTLATISRTSFLKFCTAPDLFEIHYHRAGSEFLAECAFVLTELLTTPA